MLDGSLMLWVSLPVVDTIHLQKQLFKSLLKDGVKTKAQVNQNLMTALSFSSQLK